MSKERGGLKSKILSQLPFELTPDILSRLPIEQLLQLRCCNKGFRHLIDDPYFRKLYNDRAFSSAATDTTTTVSFHCVFNPVTREELKLPPRKIPDAHKSSPKRVLNGFGYHPVTKEYKVVRIYYTRNVIEVEVYTLGTGVWRSIGVPSSLFNSTFEFSGLTSGILVNGTLHWNDKKENIASFDLKTEHFHLIPSLSSLRPPVDDGVDTSYDHCALTERLCVSRNIDHYVSDKVDIWALNKDQSAWTKEYDIAVEINPGTLLSSNDDELDEDYMYPITISKSGKLLLWYNDKFFVSYDPKNGERRIHGEYKAGYYNEIVVHVKSFVSLKALGEKNAKITRIGEKNAKITRNQRPHWRI